LSQKRAIMGGSAYGRAPPPANDEPAIWAGFAVFALGKL
jgi:hypothetical protein